MMELIAQCARQVVEAAGEREQKFVDVDVIRPISAAHKDQPLRMERCPVNGKCHHNGKQHSYDATVHSGKFPERLTNVVLCAAPQLAGDAHIRDECNQQRNGEKHEFRCLVQSFCVRSHHANSGLGQLQMDSVKPK